MRRLVLWIAVIAVVATAGVFLTKRLFGPRDSLVGRWVLVEPEEMTGAGIPAENRPIWELTLNGDGTFSEHTESHIMMDLVADATGTYKKEGEAVVLEGSSKTYSDDGYKKDTSTVPVHRTLKIVGDRLVENSPIGLKLVYAREGAPLGTSSQKAPATAERKLEPAAQQLLEAVRKKYASVRTYSDEGTFKGSGEGFSPKSAKFRTLFSRPGRFLFDVEDQSSKDRNVVWSDGHKSWLYMAMVGGAGERAVGPALATISISGLETTLVPELLMPSEFRGGRLTESLAGAEMGKDEAVGKVACRVVKLTTERGQEVTLWIDAKSLLILKALDSLMDATITYRPKAGIAIAAREFRFAPPGR